MNIDVRKLTIADYTDLRETMVQAYGKNEVETVDIFFQYDILWRRSLVAPIFKAPRLIGKFAQFRQKGKKLFIS